MSALFPAAPMGLAGLRFVEAAVRLAVFIDWSNVYRGAREAFGLENKSGRRGQVDPYRVAKVLVAAGGRRADGELVRVEVHRGRPLPNHDPLGNAAATLQQQRWRQVDPEVVWPRLRPLRFNPTTERLEEKGVDVALAVAAVEWTVLRDVDRVVIFSHDTDLSPAVETIARIKGPHAVETASWRSDRYRKRIPPINGVKNHFLHEKIFLALEDLTHYGRAARRRMAKRDGARSDA